VVGELKVLPLEGSSYALQVTTLTRQLQPIGREMLQLDCYMYYLMAALRASLVLEYGIGLSVER